MMRHWMPSGVRAVSHLYPLARNSSEDLELYSLAESPSAHKKALLGKTFFNPGGT